MKNKLKMFLRWTFWFLICFVVIYLFVLFGGWKLFKSRNPILIEVGIAILLSVFVFAGNEAAIELEKRVKALEERLNKLENKDLKGDFNLFDSTVDDVMAVYEQLKDRYDLVLTTTSALDEGFTIDCPIVVGKAHGQIIELYEDGGVFVLNVMDAAKTKGSHWHPNDVESAIDDIVKFMEGKSDYKMCHFRKV